MKMMSNRALNSYEALEESTATSISVMLSGARREKEAPDGLDIADNRRNPENSDSTRDILWSLSMELLAMLFFAMWPFVDRLLFGRFFRLF